MEEKFPADYYNCKATEFIAKADQIDPTQFLQPFINYLKAKSLVFDIGCGTGRDLIWLKRRGFRIAGMDKSGELVCFAERKLQIPIIKADFEHYDFAKHSVDGILLVSALIHIPHQRLKRVLERILQAANKSAIVYISLKEGNHTKKEDNGRVFYLWQHEELNSLFENMNLKVLEFSRMKSKLNTEEVFLSYVLQTT